MKLVDSLIGNEFGVELDGQRISGVMGIANFVTFRKDVDGTRHLPPIVLAKTVERDAQAPFNAWLRATLAERYTTTLPRRELVVLAIDDGIVIRRWLVKEAYIHEVRYETFDSSSFEMVAEVFTIGYEDIEESFPASSL